MSSKTKEENRRKQKASDKKAKRKAGWLWSLEGKISDEQMMNEACQPLGEKWESSESR